MKITIMTFIYIPLIIALPVLFIYFTEPKKENYIMYFITCLVVIPYFVFNIESQLNSKLIMSEIGSGLFFGIVSIFISLFSLLNKSWTFGKTFYNSNKAFLILFSIGWVMKLLGM
ncbi:hypothetical protein N9454_05895 [Flavobacteriaceae bacterium]|nr:hypothetical protein [Flavobacteriaceae bacterium]